MGFRRGTRELLRKNPRQKGMAPLGRYLQDFEVGDRVDIIIDPSEHKAMPHSRFHGKTGLIVAKRGRCYEVKVKQLNMVKTIFASVAHLRKNALSDQIKAQQKQDT